MKTFRKSIVVMLLLIAVPCWAQAPPLIAWLWPGTPEGSAAAFGAFKDGMRENGLVEGKDYTLDVRYAGGKYDRFPSLAGELLKLNPTIIMMSTIAAVRAVQKATKTVPIVFVSINDPLGSGLVASLARPGGNTTGLSSQNEDAVNKNIELLREVLPRASRIAVLSNPDNPSNLKMFDRIRAVASTFGISAKAFEVSTPKGLAAAFSAIAQYRPNALLVLPEAMLYDQRGVITKLSTSQRIPTFASQSEFVTSGCLISFGPNRLDLSRRSAIYVKKILGGAKPADLPVEQPTKFNLVVNLKTAKALGISIPQSLLLRADEVIQ
ncbi:MAG: ABC transporter substrate-binding protein [Nitrospirae bacterium]|nr:MAG: ABC transporter substrate-binding protein [Nitrospirota bacterium]